MKKRLSISKLIIVMLTLFLSKVTYAQDPTDSLPGDPGAIYTYIIQSLQFGTFVKGATGGTITVANNGARSATGSIVLLNQGVSSYQTIIDVEAPPYSLISITNGPDVILTGSNGGTATLEIGDSDPGSPFNTYIPPPGRTPVSIGGKLTIPPGAPPGIYTGTFYVTFNQE